MEEDLAKGILESIEMDSYRVEKKAALKILLPDENAEIGPVPAEGRVPLQKMNHNVTKFVFFLSLVAKS